MSAVVCSYPFSLGFDVRTVDLSEKLMEGVRLSFVFSVKVPQNLFFQSRDVDAISSNIS